MSEGTGNSMTAGRRHSFLRKGGIIWRNGRIIFKMLHRMMFPSRSAVPLHFRIVFKNYNIDMLGLHLEGHNKHDYKQLPFGKNQGYMGGLDSDNKIGSWGHKEVNTFWGYHQQQEGRT